MKPKKNIIISNLKWHDVFFLITFLWYGGEGVAHMFFGLKSDAFVEGYDKFLICLLLITIFLQQIILRDSDILLDRAIKLAEESVGAVAHIADEITKQVQSRNMKNPKRNTKAN